MALGRAGHWDEAATAMEEVLQWNPGRQSARIALAEARFALGDLVAVERILADATPALIEEPRMQRLRGMVAHRAGRYEEAVTHLLVALKHYPFDAEGLFILGASLQAQELHEPAAAAYRQALEAEPAFYEAAVNLSVALLTLGRFEESREVADRAVTIAPERAGAYLNRGNAVRELGRLRDAGADYRRAVELEPESAEAWSSLANLYHDLGEWVLALDAHQRAVTLAPQLPQARWNQAFTLVACGEFGAGWDAYESRWQTKASHSEPRRFPCPEWAGQSLAEQSIVVWREQGIGDEILFASCLPELVSRGAQVALIASPRLVPLLARSFPHTRVLADQGVPEPALPSDLPAPAWHIPLASLPRFFRRSRGAFPRPGAFLVPDPARQADWQTRLAALGPGPRVGICWRSGLLTAERRRHYSALAEWGAIFAVPGVTWVNLQYDDCEAEIAEAESRFGVTIHRWSGDDLRDDLEGVAALISLLDAVVTAPTVVSSLAGGLGRSTWQVDSGADWTVGGDDRSPWFPSIRVVRKSPEGDWAPVVERVGTELAAYLAVRRPGVFGASPSSF